MPRIKQSLTSIILLVPMLLNLVFPGIGSVFARSDDIAVQSLQAVYIVTNTADSGAGSLRQAVLDANASAGLDTITFAIGSPGSQQTIQPTSALPSISDPVLIDGWSQGGAGYTSSPLIEINGGLTGSYGLRITAGSSTVRGLAINGFGSGVILLTAGDNWVYGNTIGVNLAGNTAVPNNIGVSISTSSSNNIIGTNGDGVDDHLEGNLISGNGDYAIQFAQAGISSNVVAGNKIGVDISGTVAIPNGTNSNSRCGIYLGGTGNRIGTNSDGISDTLERNLISGNNGCGIAQNIQSDPAAAPNIIAGNYIGTDVTGLAALPNTGSGLSSSTGPNFNLIIRNNVISGNSGGGIMISGLNQSVITGNYIGLGADGLTPLNNGSLTYTGSVYGIFLSGNNNQIGGLGPGEGNIIANQTAPGAFRADGIALGATAQRNPIRGNNIYNNKELGIDLNDDNIANPNDAGDSDTGANSLQNYPTISFAQSYANGETVITGTLNSQASTLYSLDFYYSTAADDSGYGEGEVYLGSGQVATEASGWITFTLGLNSVAIPGGRYVTATATDPDGNTSEFSEAFGPVSGVQDVPIQGLIAQVTPPVYVDIPAAFAASVSTGTNVTYSWDFGDSGLGSGAFVTHSYATAGTYTVNITASNNNSSVITETIVTVLEPANINGVIWYDKDEDGFFGLGESSYLYPGGAVVTATLQNPSTVLTDIRDTQGNYQIFTPQAGIYGVEAGRPLWHVTTPDHVPVAVSTDGGVTINFGMNINPSAGTGRINGRAWVDSNASGYPEVSETPLPGLSLTLRNAGGVLLTAMTDAAGWINLPNLAPGTYWVDVNAPTGFYPAAQTRQVTVTAGGVANAHAPFLPGGSLSGQVSGQDGFGIGGITLTLLPDNLQIITAADGSYAFTGLTAGNRTLQITPPTNYVTPDSIEQRVVSVVLNSGSVENWLLWRKGRLTMHATQFNNGAVLPVGNMFFEVLQNGSVINFVMTDMNGQAVVDGLAPGTYSVRAIQAAILPGTMVTPAERTAIVTYDSAATLSFSFSLARSLSMYCLLPGSPPAGFKCLFEVRNSTGSLIANDSLSAANPAVTLWNLNPATLEVRLIPDPSVTGQEAWPIHSQIVVLGDNTTANVYYPFNPNNLQTISGYAFYDRCAPLGTRSNLGNCNEISTPSNNGLGVALLDSAGTVITTTQTGPGIGFSSGYFAFTNLVVGDYRAVISLPPGYTATTATEIAFSLDGIASPPQVYFGYQRFENGLITGRAFIDMDSNGLYDPTWDDALAGQPITITTAAGQPVADRTTASDGSYTFSPAGAGSYRVNLDYGGQTVTKPAQVIDNRIASSTDFPLAPLITRPRLLVFVDSNNDGVVDSGEQRLADVTLQLLNAPCRQTGALLQSLKTDASGLVEFDMLSHGDGPVCARISAGLAVELYPAGPNGVNVPRGYGQPVPLAVRIAGTLQVRPFWDANGSAQRENGEPYVSGGTVTINGTTKPVARGKAEFLLQAGSYSAAITPPAGYSVGIGLPVIVVVNNATALSLPIPLRIDGGISGMLTSPQDIGLGITVELENLATGQKRQTTTTIGEADDFSNTVFSFSNLNTGTYRLRLPNPPSGYKSASEPLVNYVAGTNQSQDLALIYVGSVSGLRFFAWFSGYPPGNVQGGQVSLVNLSNWQVTTKGSASDGSFLFDNLQSTTPYALTVPRLSGYRLHYAPGWFMPGMQSLSHDVGTTLSNAPGYDSLTASVYYQQGNTRIPLGGVRGIYYAAVNGSCEVANPPVLGQQYTDAEGLIWFLDYYGSGGGCARIVDVYGFQDLESYLISCSLPGATCSDTYGGGYDVKKDFELFPISAAQRLSSGSSQSAGTSNVSWSAYRDDNGNGEWDQDEPGISGAQLTVGGFTSTSGPDGTAVLPGLPDGVHSALTTPPSGMAISGMAGRTLALNGSDLRLPPIPLRPADVTTLYAFVDLDDDGHQGTDEHGLGNVLFELSGPASASATSLPDGRAMFTELPDGVYTVTVLPPAGVAPATPFILTLTNGGMGAVALHPEQIFSGLPYEDWDGDGLRLQDEPVYRPPISLTLQSASATLKMATSAGLALQPGISPGNYTLTSPFSLLESQSTVIPTGGSLGLGLPIVPPGVVRGIAWLDTNGDGDRQPWEVPLAGIPVTLNGQTRVTNRDGRYLFFGVPSGNYLLTVELPSGLQVSTPNVSVSDERGAAIGLPAAVVSKYTIQLPLIFR